MSLGRPCLGEEQIAIRLGNKIVRLDSQLGLKRLALGEEMFSVESAFAINGFDFNDGDRGHADDKRGDLPAAPAMQTL